MNYHLVLMKSNVLIPRSRGRSVTSPPRSSTSPSMRSTSTRGSARTFTGNYFKFCKGCPISRRTSVGLTENTPILRTNSTYNSDKGEGGSKNVVVNRKIQNHQFRQKAETAEIGLFCPKVPSFGRKWFLSAEREVTFRPK